MSKPLQARLHRIEARQPSKPFACVVVYEDNDAADIAEKEDEIERLLAEGKQVGVIRISCDKPTKHTGNGVIRDI